MKISWHHIKTVALCSLFLIMFQLSAVAQKEKKASILFAPQWKINETVKYDASIERTVTQGDFQWTGQFTNNVQQFTVLAKDDSSFVVQWKAEGFPINIFQDFPGPMYDWFQQWSKGKVVNFKIRFNNLGVPISVMNADSIRSFYTTMINDFMSELPTRNVAPLKKENVKQSLQNLKTLVIPAKTFSSVFLSNLSLLFPLYGKTFYKNQDLKLTQYQQLLGINFSVPIRVHTQLVKDPNNQYQLISTKKPLPFNQWRIKPAGYQSIDFTYSDSLLFKYNNNIQWITNAKHIMNYERSNYSDKFVISYTKVK